MAYFTNPSQKLEKAVRAFLILQEAPSAKWDNSFISNDSRKRMLPNRTFAVTAFAPTRPYRPEGVCFLEIQHHFPAIVQPNQTNTLNQPDYNAQQNLFDTFFGDTMDALNFAGTDDQNMGPLADQITAAGRWLAVTDGTPEGNQIALDNTEMANFRCDWVKFSNPSITRGKPNDDTVNWVEIIHLQAFVSNATN